MVRPNSDYQDVLRHLERQKPAIGAGRDDLLVAFYDGQLRGNYFLAGARYDETTPCTAVVSLKFLGWEILEEKFNYDLQRHAILHLLVCSLLGAYTHVDAHEETFGCLFDFNRKLSDFNRKLARGYYLCSPAERDCFRRVEKERYGRSIVQLCSALKSKLGEKQLQVTINELNMEIFKEVKNSTVINRSVVGSALNSISTGLGNDYARALIEIAKRVENSSNAAAGTLFDEFSRELAKADRDKGRLKELWNGLTRILPDVATVSEAVAKLVSIFT